MEMDLPPEDVLEAASFFAGFDAESAFAAFALDFPVAAFLTICSFFPFVRRMYTCKFETCLVSKWV